MADINDGGSPQSAAEWVALGIKKVEAGELEEALKAFVQALELDPNHQEACGKRGDTLHKLGRTEEAIESHQSWFDVALKNNDSWGIAASQFNLGSCYLALSRKSEAVNAYTQAHRLFRQIKNEQWSVEAYKKLNQFGIDYINEKQYPEAILLYQEQRRILQAFNDQKNLGWILQNLGQAHFYLQDYQAAIECHTLMLEIARFFADKSMESSALAWLVCDRWNAGQLDFALHYCKQRLPLVKEENNIPAQKETLGWAISLAKQLGNGTDMPVPYMIEQIELFRQLEEKENERSALYDLGSWQLNIKQYQEAIGNFTLAASLGEAVSKANAFFMLGKSYKMLGQQAEAIEHYQKGLDLYIEHNNQEWANISLSQMSEVYSSAKDYPKAIEMQKKRLEFADGLKGSNQKYGVLYEIGVLYYNAQQESQAIEYFTSSLDLAQEIGEKGYLANNHYMLGSSHERLGHIDRAIEHYRQAETFYRETENQQWLKNSQGSLKRLEEKKNEPQKWKAQAELLFSQGRYGDAIFYYEKLSNPESEENYALALHKLGIQQYQLRQYKAALISFKRFLELNPTNTTAWMDRAAILKELKEYQESLTCLDHALQLEPHHPQAWLERAGVLFDLKQYSQALEASKLAVELNPNNPSAWIIKGAILANGLEMYVEALENFKQALLLDTGNATALKNRSIVLSALGFTKEEISKPDHSNFDFDLNKAEDCQELGDIRKNQGQYKEALIMYDRALSLEPNNDNLWRKKGSVLWKLRQPEEGLKAYNKAIALNFSNIPNYIEPANELLDLGINDAALKLFDNALLLTAGKSWQAWVGKGKALSNMGKSKEALDSLYKGILDQSLSPTLSDKQEGIIELSHTLGCVHVKEARTKSESSDAEFYWLEAKKAFENCLNTINDFHPVLERHKVKVLQDLIPVERALGNSRDARRLLYEGIETLERLEQNCSYKHQQDELSKEFRQLTQWQTDERAEYRKFFMELLDGVNEAWNQEQVREYLEEYHDDSYFIRWLHDWCKEELERKNGIPDFDRGYLMIQLGNILSGEIGQTSQDYGNLMIAETIDKVKKGIDNIHELYATKSNKEFQKEYFRSYNHEKLSCWSYDYRIVQSCSLEYRQKIDIIEESLVSFYADIPSKKDDYLAWFNLGEELRKLDYDKPAIIAFCRTLRLTKGQFWEAWASWGYINLKEPVGLSIVEIGLKFLRRARPDYEDACGVLHEIQGDYYQEGLGVLYEIRGDLSYRYEYAKGYSTGSIPINMDKFQIIFDYKVLQEHIQNAYNYYKKALECFTTPRLQKRRLGVFKKLVKVCRFLGESDEASYFRQEGADLLGRLLQEASSTDKKMLKIEFAAFDQYRIDELAQSSKYGEIFDALLLADKRKSFCLTWLQEKEVISPNIELNNYLISSLLNSLMAVVYWHISPAAITLFILKDQIPIKVRVLKNEGLYKTFCNPDSLLKNTPFLKIKITQEDFEKGTSGLYDNQLVKFEYWMIDWQKAYHEYRYGKKKDPLVSSEEKKLSDGDHPWRKDMISKLDKLAEILQIDDLIQEYLSDVKHLILIPHRDLHLLPLEYLFRDRGFAISRLPSLQLALDLPQKAAPTLPPLSIEEPETAYNLNFAQVESSVLAHRYSIPKENRIQGKDATHLRILQSIKIAADILHFTGHGEHNLDSPGESALILAHGERLTLRQILSLPLREYYLVCLSACETGLTSTSNLMDEFVGLVSAFLAKKTSFILSTLWRVDQISTALLVIEFYQGIKAGVHPAISLRDAQDKLRSLTYAQLAQWYDELAGEIKNSDRGCAQYLKQFAREIRSNSTFIDSDTPPYAHPYFWAGFTITGKFGE